VCETGGYVTSYWNRPFFPEWCSNDDFDDTATYDTMVRIAGSWSGVAMAFKAVADMYGWTHIVAVSNNRGTCWYGVKPFGDVFDSDKNYTYTWLKIGDSPTDEQLDAVLQQIRARTRGFHRQLMFLGSMHSTYVCGHQFTPPATRAVLKGVFTGVRTSSANTTRQTVFTPRPKKQLQGIREPSFYCTTTLAL